MPSRSSLPLSFWDENSPHEHHKNFMEHSTKKTTPDLRVLRVACNITNGPLPLSLLWATSKCSLGAAIGAKKDVYSHGILIPSSAKKKNKTKKQIITTTTQAQEKKMQVIWGIYFVSWFIDCRGRRTQSYQSRLESLGHGNGDGDGPFPLHKWS